MNAEELTAERRRALARRILTAKGLAAAPNGSGQIPTAPTGTPLPLSSSQQRMWLHQRLHPGSAAYNLTVAVRLDGELNVTALREAVQDVVGRHDVLRTSYPADESATPVQLAAASVVIPLPVTDMSDVDESTWAGAVAEAAGRFGAEAIDITRDPPLRPRLFRLGPTRHVLVLVIHHIACDDSTWGILLDDLARGYRARIAGQPSPLPTLPIQYGDFAAWEQARLREGRMSHQLDYWRTRLSPPPAPLEVATEPRRQPDPSEAGARRSVVLPARVRTALRELGQRAGCTPFMVILAGFTAMLHRYTDSDDIAVGSPVINRDQPELRGLVGNFGNTIVLRTDTSGDPSFRDLLDRVRPTCVDGYAHQELPFDRLVSELAVERTNGRNPLFGVLFSMRSEVFDNFTLPGLRTSEVEVHNGTARFDLSVQVRDTGDDLVLSLVYRTDLYSDAAAERMLNHLSTLLAGAAANPESRLSALPLLTPSERLRILHDWNDTRRDDLTAEPSLTAMVERQVARTPDQVAVISGHEQLTYRELNERANRLARHLRELGVDRDVLVGLHLHRSAELVIAILAVLKAGGAYLPLEPSWPAARIAEVATGANLTLILHHPRSGPLPTSLAHTVVNLDTARTQQQSADNLTVATDPENLANVLYTSGSTGRPKGVMTPHRAICNRLSWQREVLGIASDDTVLHKAPPGFDVSMSEIFLPLVSGARLLVAEPDGERDPAYLLQLIELHQATFIYLVPAMLDVLLGREDFARRARSLRYVWSGGEVLTPELFALFRERFPELPLYHSYGLTETTITATWEPYTGTRKRIGTTVGRPIANTQCYVLDRHLNLVPVGVTGELYVGGAQLARGYLNESELTAARFVPDPFGDGAGRLYRTGDLGRLGPDGTIEFLGRADNQVKIRGLRIEPEEIEAKLKPHPDVRQAAVVARTLRGGPTQLVVYCVPESANLLDEADIRRWLSTRLPDYMVPSDIVFLPELPVLASGKIDRKSLAGLPPRRIEPVRASAPSQGVERRIADVWCEVLGVDQVDPEGNFFDLGGDSLLLLKVQARLASELGREITRVDLFAYTTVRSLAGHLGRGEQPDQRGQVLEVEQRRGQSARARRERATDGQ
jgi:amino acid adenylation domain-containing protein